MHDLAQLHRRPAREQRLEALGELAVVPPLAVTGRLEASPELVADDEVVARIAPALNSLSASDTGGPIRVGRRGARGSSSCGLFQGGFGDWKVLLQAATIVAIL
jgi:hypothetical protein